MELLGKNQHMLQIRRGFYPVSAEYILTEIRRWKENRANVLYAKIKRQDPVDFQSHPFFKKENELKKEPAALIREARMG